MTAVRLAGDCPACGAEIVVRRRRKDGGRFVSCSAYPECRWCGDYDAHLQALAEQLETARAKGSPEMSRALRDVIVFAHPDRWPDAAELAHGVTARLAALRDKL